VALYLIGNVPGASGPRLSVQDPWPHVTFAEARIIRRLAEALDGETISRIVSGPSIRCLQTVAMLAAEREVDVEVWAELGEIASVTRALDCLPALAGAPSVVCMPAPLLRPLTELLLLGNVGVVPHGRLALLKRIDESELVNSLQRCSVLDHVSPRAQTKPRPGHVAPDRGVWERKVESFLVLPTAGRRLAADRVE
jgi:hypothetical protein